MNIKVLAETAAHGLSGGGTEIEDDQRWWEQLRKGVSGLLRVKLTNKLFRFCRDYLIKNAERYVCTYV